MVQHGHAHHDPEFDWAALVGFAEAEAELLTPFLVEATSMLAEQCDRDGVDVRRILDVGSGPGVGTCVLARRFPSATVVAADGSPEMLARIEPRADRLGLAGRVETRLVDLPVDLESLGRAELVWVSMVLHHVGDEAAALRGLRARLEPGGLLALVEFGEPARFVPDDADLGRPGLWERLDVATASWLAGMRAGLPGAVPSADYPAMLQSAGFDLLVDRMSTLHFDPPLDDRARRVALGYLTRMREHVEPYADAGDLAALAVLTDEDDRAGIMRRDDALLHLSRRLIVARAPR
jgi:SAM-dependent methyltransferase